MHRVVAAAFLLFLLVEWGSHSLAFSHAATEGASLESSETQHEDPCKTLIRCSDGKQPYQVTFRPDNQHNGFLDDLLGWRPVGRVMKEPPLVPDPVHSLSRSVNPPFHPPKFS